MEFFAEPLEVFMEEASHYYKEASIKLSTELGGSLHGCSQHLRGSFHGSLRHFRAS